MPALTFFVPTPAGLRTRLASLNLVVIVSYASPVRFSSAKQRLMLVVIRAWLPLGMVLPASGKWVGFGLPHQATSFESRWIIRERIVLGH
jgi:hypothetical protein